MSRRRYVVLDVFTDRPLAGNGLAVVLDAEDLDTARMQAIAAEFNLAETVFVLPPERPPVHAAKVRIFTPQHEMPFAGHPTVGTAVLLALDAAGPGAATGAAVIVLEEPVGPIRSAVAVEGEGIGYAVFDVPRVPEPVGAALDREAVAAALGLLPAEIGFENHRLSAFSAGAPFVFVPVRDRAALFRAMPIGPAWKRAFPTVSSAYLYTRDTVSAESAFHARMFGGGTTEDPATGSAAAALAGVVHAFDKPPAGTHRYVIEQGYAMGRPSLITLEIDIEGGAVDAARIGGRAIVVARGELLL